ncbi:MAG TPA: hypothetical protein VEI04_07610 [Syntrophobacteria bacterium]|nr:hypothetical protein [Syntrophobacteria bacterium]
MDCPLYDLCLTRAARHNWRGWNCAPCPNFPLRAVRERLRLIEPYYELLVEIYPEFRAKYEAVWTLVHRVPSRREPRAVNV